MVSWRADRVIKTGNRNIELVDPTAGRTDLLLGVDSVGWIFNLVYSPDGRKLAVCWNRTIDSTENVRDLFGIWIATLGDSVQEPNRIVEGWAYPLYWSPDGNWIYFVYDEKQDMLCRVNLFDHSIDTVLQSPLKGTSRLTLADTSNIVMVVWESQSDLWLAKAVESRTK